MIHKIKVSLKSINYKLYTALLILGLVPTIYTTIRIFFLGQIPNEWTFSIAGQLSWVNLLYEVLNESIILPLFFFIGSVKKNNTAFANHLRTGMLISFFLYAFLSIFIILFTEPLLLLMATDISIIQPSAQYIRIESIANIFSILSQFVLVALVSINKNKYLYAITATRLLLCIVFDLFLVSYLPMSLCLGVNGIAYSNILVNTVILILSLIFLSKEGIFIFENTKLDFSWAKDFFKIGGISGLESLVRNLAYILMISRMVNIVGEQGTYWVANNFIWGWLLLPVIQLGELIKQEVSTDSDNIRKHSLGYFSITFSIIILWFVTVPLWKPFMSIILNFEDVDKLLQLVLLLVVFYIFYAFQNVFDATFYGMGKTNYMLFESVITNTIYYGFAFILYKLNFWTPTLQGIALLFGFGNIFDSIVSLLAYRFFLKKEKINILNI